jgi:hypothetical protein
MFKGHSDVFPCLLSLKDDLGVLTGGTGFGEANEKDAGG